MTEYRIVPSNEGALLLAILLVPVLAAAAVFLHDWVIAGVAVALVLIVAGAVIEGCIKSRKGKP